MGFQASSGEPVSCPFYSWRTFRKTSYSPLCCPSRYSDGNCCLHVYWRIETELHIPLPGPFGGLLEPYLPLSNGHSECRRSKHVDFDIDCRVFSLEVPHVPSNGREKPAHVWRTTGTHKPLLSLTKLFITRCQRIFICEFLPIARHASQHGIVEAEFHDIPVLAIEVELCRL